MTAALLAEDPDARAVPYCMSGGTDAKTFSGWASGATVSCRCACPRPGLRGMFHGVDERVPLDALEFGRGCSTGSWTSASRRLPGIRLCAHSVVLVWTDRAGPVPRD